MITNVMRDSIRIKTSVMNDLMRLTAEIQDRVESIELINDKDFMTSLKKSDEQIKKRDFVDWNAI